MERIRKREHGWPSAAHIQPEWPDCSVLYPFILWRSLLSIYNSPPLSRRWPQTIQKFGLFGKLLSLLGLAGLEGGWIGGEIAYGSLVPWQGEGGGSRGPQVGDADEHART